MKLTVNGKTQEIENGATLVTLLALLDINRETVVVEVNGDIVEQKDFDKKMLAEDDKVELIRFVGGG